ncbi:UNVERIFIED_CONTAM: putative galactinol--sucrose galactosyltransferase 6 [Sesamum angustifolium]|uniref:Galactinol--sucrose galactosyltransferase 6 n=1 Tax=Sesamum angustifolium TaxID=2727405 RepID=A0AAW2MTQ4_9LAMI
MVSSLSIPIHSAKSPPTTINTPSLNTSPAFTSRLAFFLPLKNRNLFTSRRISSSQLSFSSPNSILAYRGSEVERKEANNSKQSAMTIKPAVRIAERKLVVKDRTILTNVPESVIATSGAAAGPVEGVFCGL